MTMDEIADKNASQLNFVNRALRGFPSGTQEMQRQQPGSRPDGGMVSSGLTSLTPLQATHDMVRQILDNETNLRHQVEDLKAQGQKLDDEVLRQENEIIELRAKLDLETKQSEHYRNMLRKIAELVVNGAKHKNDMATQQ